MSLSLNPQFLFPGQQAGEKIHLVTRKHWVVLARDIVIWLIFVVILFGYDWFLVPQFPFLRTPEAAKIANLIKTVYLMYVIGGLMALWVLYYLNYQIITNERIVDVDQKNLLFHSTTELHLAQVEDVTSEIKGFLGNLFNYGNVYVQTAGARTRFEFDYIPDPNAVVKIILDLYQKIPPGAKGEPK